MDWVGIAGLVVGTLTGIGVIITLVQLHKDRDKNQEAHDKIGTNIDNKATCLNDKIDKTGTELRQSNERIATELRQSNERTAAELRQSSDGLRDALLAIVYKQGRQDERQQRQD